jgi:membrane protease YdiL (CAAX protease family)
MSVENILRLGVPALLALATVVFFDRACERQGLTPPGFRVPWRRALALAILGAMLWRGIFVSLGAVGLDMEMDLTGLGTPRLFLLHGLLILTILAWFFLGFAGTGAGAGAGPGMPLGRQLAAQLGLVAPDVPRELGLGVVLGVGAWVAVIAVLFVIALVMWAAGAQSALPRTPPELVPFLAGLPMLVRFLLSLSAGVVEEVFFRGFLQPRVGIALSSALFVLAHFSYGQPFMLVGIAVLSVIYGLIVRWRQNIWPAIVAHTLFDAVQLLVMIPAVLRLLPQHGAAAAAILPGVL